MEYQGQRAATKGILIWAIGLAGDSCVSVKTRQMEGFREQRSDASTRDMFMLRRRYLPKFAKGMAVVGGSEEHEKESTS